MKITLRHSLLLLGPVLGLMLTACDPGEPSPLSADLSSGQSSLSLTQTEFAALPAEDQYRVVNKLTGTFLRGVPADEFFDLRRGDTDTLRVINEEYFEDIRHSLNTALSVQVKEAIDIAIDGIDAEGNPNPAVARYLFCDRDSVAFCDLRPRQVPLVRIKEYPISRDLFVNWMAYFLTNTIMFSPATEMESTEVIDAQRVFRFLVARIEAGDSVRSIIRSNLASLHRWRVSRSAENHALEAYELYLGLFDTEEDSYRGGIACKDYYLTDDSEGYLIDITDFPNTEPQLILNDYFVTSCEDLYDVIAGHPAVIPRVTEVIANYLFSGKTLEERRVIINQVVAANPETFEDIFKLMIFSREYLLDTERPMSFEENLMSMLDRLHWSPKRNNSGEIGAKIFRNMTKPGGSSQIAMHAMGWDTMALKIGRLPDVPLDALSFANYHKAMREDVLRNARAYNGNGTNPAGLIFNDFGQLKQSVGAMSTNSFIDYLFLTTLMRKPSEEELAGIRALIIGKNYTSTDSDTGLEVINFSSYTNVTVLVFDYISRLPELYYFKRISGDDA